MKRIKKFIALLVVDSFLTAFHVLTNKTYDHYDSFISIL